MDQEVSRTLDEREVISTLMALGIDVSTLDSPLNNVTDSLGALMLISELELRFGVFVDVDILANDYTVKHLVADVVSSAGPAPRHCW